MNKNKIKELQTVSKYLDRNVRYADNIISGTIHSEYMISVVIPAYNERFEDLWNVLTSLSIQSTNIPFQTIVVINHTFSDSITIKQQSEHLANELQKRLVELSFPLIVIRAFDLKPKKGGVGMARKIGMDAITRACFSDRNNAVITCLDADSIVSGDYINQIHDYFDKSNKDAVSINYEHHVDGLSPVHNLAIKEYELHLRYFIAAQLHIRLPFAFHTVGSSMAVRAWAYASEGGMPILKAGEDFYFLHKFIAKNKCGKLSNILVYPSGRVSDRVPFGTGKAVGDIVQSSDSYKTYAFNSFTYFQAINQTIFDSYPDFNEELLDEFQKATPYLKSISFFENLWTIVKNTSNKDSFTKRYYQYMDAFQLMKYLHFMRDNHYVNQPVLEVVNDFQKAQNKDEFENIKYALQYYRNHKELF